MFKITAHQGFQIEFENGWTVSVQFGPGNYCDHHPLGGGGIANFMAPMVSEHWESNTAEIAAWDKDGNWHHFSDGQQVMGWVTPYDVAVFIALVATQGGTPPQGELEPGPKEIEK